MTKKDGSDSSAEEEKGYLDDVSASPDTDVNAADTSAVDEGARDVKGADQDAKGPTSMLEAVQAAVEKDEKTDELPSGSEEGSEDTASTEGESDDAEAGQAEAEGEDAAKDAEKEPPFHKHPRWQQLLKERDTLREERDSHQEAHSSVQQMTAFMEEADLSVDEVNGGLALMRAIKKDPEVAYQQLKTLTDQMAEITGHVLPEDIQDAVDQGRIADDLAHEMSRTRQANLLNREQTQRAQQDTAVAVTDEAVSAITRWEQDWKASDLDFKQKHPRVHEKVELEILRAISAGQSITPDMALEIAETAKKAVEADFRKAAPRKKSLTPVTGGASAPTDVEPKTMREAMDLALKQGNRAA